MRKGKLMHARVLGYLIQEGPSMQARVYVNRCNTYKEMDKLGDMFFVYFIRVCESLPLHCPHFSDGPALLTVKKYKGPMPTLNPHPFRHDSEAKKDMIRDMLREPPKDYHKTKKEVRATSTCSQLQPFQ